VRLLSGGRLVPDFADASSGLPLLPHSTLAEYSAATPQIEGVTPIQDRIMSPKQYAAVGKCIYDPSHLPGPAGFTCEHIIPYSLGGDLVLPEASCDDCQKETHAFEGFCAGTILKPARTHFNWRSRKSKRPATLGVGSSHSALEQVPMDEHPPLVLLPMFPCPEILLNIPEDSAMDGRMVMTGVTASIGPDFDTRVKALRGSKKVGTTFKIDPLCRMLAKIAHAYTVAKLDLSNFQPFLNDIILGKSDRWSRCIGSMRTDKLDITTGLHSLKLQQILGYYVVSVGLYSQLGLCPYVVVSGKP
jgi:hypothetical protein